MANSQQIQVLAGKLAKGDVLTQEIEFTQNGDLILPWDQLEHLAQGLGSKDAIMDPLITALEAAGANPHNDQGAVVPASVIERSDAARKAILGGKTKVRGANRPDWIGSANVQQAGAKTSNQAGNKQSANKDETQQASNKPTGFQKGAEVIVTQAGAMHMLARLRMRAFATGQNTNRARDKEDELLRKLTGIRGTIVESTLRPRIFGSGTTVEILVDIPGVFGPDGGYWNFAPEINPDHVIPVSVAAAANQAKHLGMFIQSSTEMIVCDLGDDYYTREVKGVLPGTWSAWATKTWQSGGIWMETLTVHNESVSLSDLTEASWSILTNIGMYRCLCGIVDAKVQGQVDLEQVGKLTMPNPYGEPKFGAGVILGGAVSYSGWGQESFNIYVAKNQSGKIVAIRAYFINDPNPVVHEEE